MSAMTSADTLAAIKAVQAEHQLKVDGKIGLQNYMGMARHIVEG